jgi:RNA polymerase subunit RPABC4/transcription elongation factor Spt4
MAIWKYQDADGFWHETNGKTMINLIAAGAVLPDTPIETPDGKKSVAGKLKLIGKNEELFKKMDATPTDDLASSILQIDAKTPMTTPVEQGITATRFCTNCGNPVSKNAVACLSCGAAPTGHRKFCQQCGMILNPEQIICIKCGAGVNNTVSEYNANDIILSPDQTIKTLNTYFMVFWICYVAGLPLCLVFVGIFGIITGCVFGCMLLYQAWKLIPPDIARTTPGKAVGFGFIPFFNFYWIFVSWVGLCQDMNETLRRRGIQYRVSENLAMSASVLFVVDSAVSCLDIIFFTPFSFLLSIPLVIVNIFFYKSIKNGAVGLLSTSNLHDNAAFQNAHHIL